MNDRPIFHITHLSNLRGMIAEAKIWSDSKRIHKELESKNIGHQHIKDRRLKRKVKVAAGGVLGDYVPFNFCKRSVMLYVIHRGNVDGYDDGQDPVVHLVSTVGLAVETGRPWAFTDRHAELGYAKYFESLYKEDQVDWSVMPLGYWAESEETKEKRQAEFLVHNWLPFNAITKIVVKTRESKSLVQEILEPSEFSPDVLKKPSWYY